MKQETITQNNSFKDLKLGQKVWVLPPSYSGKETTPYETSVVKLGRKYFEMERPSGVKFNLSDGIMYADTNYKSRVYLSLQIIQDEKKHSELSEQIKKAFRVYGNLPYSLDQLQRIVDIIQEPR
jgi:hypothetical protein